MIRESRTMWLPTLFLIWIGVFFVPSVSSLRFLTRKNEQSPQVSPRISEVNEIKVTNLEPDNDLLSTLLANIRENRVPIFHGSDPRASSFSYNQVNEIEDDVKPYILAFALQRIAFNKNMIPLSNFMSKEWISNMIVDIQTTNLNKLEDYDLKFPDPDNCSIRETPASSTIFYGNDIMTIALRVFYKLYACFIRETVEIDLDT